MWAAAPGGDPRALADPPSTLSPMFGSEPRPTAAVAPRPEAPGPATITIHPMSKRSVTIPKHGDQKVFVRGICTLPPSARASKTCAGVRLGGHGDREPEPIGLRPVVAPVGGHQRGAADPERGVHDLLLEALLEHPGRRRLGALVVPHHHLDLGPECLAVELDRLLAAAGEEQVRGDGRGGHPHPPFGSVVGSRAGGHRGPSRLAHPLVDRAARRIDDGSRIARRSPEPGEVEQRADLDRAESSRPGAGRRRGRPRRGSRRG